jgi:hypothetical protein
MVKFYADRIEAGKKSIEQVPSLWRAKVQEELERREKERTETA